MTELASTALQPGRTSFPLRPHLRRDLQGVRGLGIILVVIGHLWRWPPGVFAMLDMFFVLSGFLITGILVRSLEQHGPRFLVAFYLSRFRRLMPAAITVIVVTVGLSYLVFSEARGDVVKEDGIWALLFSVNWHFATTGTDYFSEQAASPLLHYWSLSVEEQFYAIWPALILGILMLSRRRGISRKATLVLSLGAVTCLAFAYSMWHSVAAPAAAYYSTIDRIWEFGIGGLIAVLSPRLARLPLWLGAALGWGGTFGLVAAICLIPYGVPFPAPWGLLPTLLTGAILAGGIDRDTRYIPLLDNRLMVYLGDLSYSIYLCHLPTNLLLLPFFSEVGPDYYITAITVTLGASMACYYLVERPLRNAPWLMTAPERRRLTRPSASSSLHTLWVAGLAAATAVLVLSVTVTANRHPPENSSAQALRRGDPTATTSLDRHQAMLLEAVQRRSFPDFDPPLSELTLEDWAAELDELACTSVTSQMVSECQFGPPDAGKRAVVMGDSYAMAWMPGILQALLPKGWHVQQLTYQWCPTWTLPSYVSPEGTPSPECAANHRELHSHLEEVEPDLVILASGAGQVANADRKDIPGDPVGVARAGLAETIARLRPHTRSVVVLAPPPGHASLVDCVSRVAGPERCVTRPSSYWYDHVAGESMAAADVGARYVATENWFCLERACPGFVGHTPVTVDGSHLTIDFSRQLSPLLRQALLAPNAVHHSSSTE